MANIKFILSKRIECDGKGEVYARYPISRLKYIQCKTGVRVKPEWFFIESMSGNCKVGHIEVPKRGRLNNEAVREAERARAEVQDYVLRMIRVMSLMDGLSAKSLKIAVDGTKDKAVNDIMKDDVLQVLSSRKETEKKKTMSEWMDVYLREKTFPKIHHNHLLGVMRIVHRWEAYRQEIEGEAWRLDIDKLTSEDVEDLRCYMLNEADLQDEHKRWYDGIMKTYPAEISTKHTNVVIKKRGANAVVKLMKLMQAFWNWMLEKKVTTNMPFMGVRIGSAKYGTPYYLTIEERNRLADFDLSARPKLAVQRDIFVFQCLVGCRVGDLCKLTERNITNGILEYVPHKTKDEAVQVKPRVPLNARAQALIIKYSGVDRKGRLFPFISTQKYNEAIKEALRVCGIERNVIVRNALTGENEIKQIWEVASSHMARRTFVGAAYSKVQDPNIVGRMSGHVEGSRAFARYREIGDEILEDVIGKID